ncbi:MAG: aldo/keto reductase [Deltaproteobacteria bacterium]|nr:aldo/keto reductase [Deltaproteobacteria bacterium]
MTRRQLLRAFLASGLYMKCASAMAATTTPMIRRVIPQSGETLPVIGLGTWQTFDVGGESERAPLRAVLREFAAYGGSVIDSSPMYGRSESVAGDLIAEATLTAKIFFATKVWTQGREPGIRQMEESFRRLRTPRMDLLQVHNLVDWRTHLATLRSWKEPGKLRYIGVTHYTESGYGDLERVMKAEPLDFVQLNYSIAERSAEKRLLALAAERKIAVLVNRPFGGGGLIKRVLPYPLPSFAAQVDCSSWAQLLLKFAISHPAVTCAIPATSKVAHLRDNMQAGFGALPDQAMRAHIARHVEAL